MRVKKLLAMFLLVLLLCQPMLALQSLASAESSGCSEEPSIVRELTELRRTDSSTFLRDDGTYECVIYSEDKFYRNAGGEMTEIDNSSEIRRPQPRKASVFAWPECNSDCCSELSRTEDDG